MTTLRLWSDEIEAMQPEARAAVGSNDGPFAAITGQWFEHQASWIEARL